MRMRKKKWAQPYLDSHPEYALVSPQDYKGKWKEFLQCEKLHVEIGTGKGGYLLAMSKMYPQDGWVGIERDHSVAAVACRKALESEESIANRRMIAGTAEELEEWFAPGEIDVIHLNFSDPWPKKKTHKKRLSSEKFLNMYRSLLSEEGEIRMKTDNKALFEDSVRYFVDADYRLQEFSVDYRRNPHEEDAITEYEQKFMEEGMPIYQLCAVVRKEEN